MCTPWTDEQWVRNSKPADSDSRYTLKDTRYNQNGEVARTYLESDGWFWAVLPGTGNSQSFTPYDRTNENLRALALDHLAKAGYTLTDPPANTAETLPSSSPDLVENLA